MPNVAAILVARLIFGGAFLMATNYKFADMNATAGYIASISFPASLPFTWVAAFFELGFVLAFFSGAFFREATVASVAYVLFIARAFHGPGRWQESPMKFGFFVGLLFAAVHGPGARFAFGWRLPAYNSSTRET